MTIFVSTIIPTIGRDLLSRAVESVLSQQTDHVNFEVIVVNDSGKALQDMNWKNAPNLRIIQTNRRERSIARNVGAAVARGQFLHFLDDDDWILPGALAHFWKLAQEKQAAMYYGGYRFVDSNGYTLEECHPNEEGNCFIRFMAGEWQPLQASLFDSQIFHSIGGFKSLEMLRGGDEDVDLTRRISLKHNIAGIRQLVAEIRIDRSESTTNYSNLQEQSRQSKDMILNMPGSFTRLYESAKERSDASYWHGKVLWIYLSSIAWNIQHKNLFITFSRVVYYCLGFFMSFRYWFTTRFWRGATRGHRPKGWLVAE